MATSWPAGERFRPRLPVPIKGALVFLVAGLHLVATVVVWELLQMDFVDAVVLAVPSLCMLAFTAVLVSGPLPEETCSRILLWTVGGMGVFGASLVSVLLARGQFTLSAAPLLLFITGIGGIGGLLIGYTRGNSIAAQRRAKELEMQQDRLLFLNQLLRHNVLNNVAIIKGYADLIASEHDLEEPRFDTIRDRSEAVTELIDNVRLLVRVFQGESERRPVAISTPLREEAAGLEQTYPDVELATSIEDELTVVADPLVRYVFENVLHNAVQHNDAETPAVTVEARRDADTVVVAVTDNGPGIPDPIVEELDTEDRDVNHGIGLYLIDVLMDRYGGDLDISDDDPRGTVVSLTFQRPTETRSY